MKRYLLGLVWIGVVFLFVQCVKNNWTKEELVGKKRPELKGEGCNLRPEVAEAFSKMRLAAKDSGITIYSVSSYRDFNRQKGIWERKWARYESKGLKGINIANEIIKYSTIPGTSRHHWGTDLDVIDTNIKLSGDKLLAKHFMKEGAYDKLHTWLTKNASDYGFYLVYTNDVSRKGFNYEPWHLSYKPIAQEMFRAYKNIDWKKELLGVKGIASLPDNFFLKYQKEQIEDINPVLK
jgi:LAS superfamily LD-carboxypeptidase LdcB